MRFTYFKVVKIPRFLMISLIILMALGITGYHYIKGRITYEAIDVISWSVANKVIVVDAGHGGIDPGAVGASGALEKDINLAIAKRLSHILSQAGAVVIMTREEDTCYSGKKKTDLDARIALARDHEADAYLSIQGNAIKSSKWSGAQTFYHPKSEESKKLAVSIQDEMRQILKNTKRKARPHTEAYILKQLKMPTVVVEVGFLSNPGEERMLNDPYYQGKVAWSIYAGVVKYFAEDKEVKE